jgi:hypothetical protein
MKNRDIGIILGLLPFLVITLTLFAKSPIDTASLTDNAVAVQPYPNLQPFPSTSTGQMQIQQSQPQQPLNLNAPNSVSVGNTNNNSNPFQNLQNQIDQLKAIISNLHGQKLVVTERSAPDFINADTEPFVKVVESKAVCNSDEVVTGGGYMIDRDRGVSDFNIWKNSASGNGWSVEVTANTLFFKAVAECAKLT